ncbi:unnamed protein product, partial [Didymodactylos carnosus]
SARISNLNPEAYHVYCNADSLDLALQDLTRESPPVASALDMTNEIGNYSLDLALQDLTRESPPVASALDMTNEIVNCMKKSPKRLHLLDKLTGLNNYSNLKPLRSLAEISTEGGPPSAKANGYLEQMQKFSTYFGFKLVGLGDLIIMLTLHPTDDRTPLWQRSSGVTSMVIFDEFNAVVAAQPRIHVGGRSFAA